MDCAGDAIMNRVFCGVDQVCVCVVVLAGFERWVFRDGDTFKGGRGAVLVGVYVVPVKLLVKIPANALEDLADVWEKKQFLKTLP